jgi:DUF4097 and DUF4098 domain-containing protein YvlB
MGARRLFIFISLTLLLLPHGRGAEREFARTFPVEPGCTVKVDTYRGSITIVESDQPEVRVLLQMQLATDNEDEAAKLYAALQLEATAESHTISLRARNPWETRVRFAWNDKRQIDLAWRITVPRQSNVEVVTLNGSIAVGNLTGRVVARTERGTLSIKRIDGSVDARAEVGNIVISRCTGPVKARVLRGTMRIGTIGGAADLKNSTGDIDVLAALAGITASAEAGDVLVGFPNETTGDARLNTSGGSIHVRIDPATNCAINASSVWGRVESLLPLKIESGANGRSKLAGRLGTGGPTFTFHANGGHVKIVPSENWLE